jgi:hypothetical protein
MSVSEPVFFLSGKEKCDGVIMKPYIFKMVFKGTGKVEGEIRYQNDQYIYQIDGDWEQVLNSDGDYIAVEWAHSRENDLWNYHGKLRDEDGNGISSGAVITGCINENPSDDFEFTLQ